MRGPWISSSLSQFLGFGAFAPALRGPVRYGTIVIAVFFGVFGGWEVMAPLDSAAIAPGVVTVTSNRRQVQHLEGGIVSRILVGEGDKVSAGDPLVILSSTRSGATLSVLEKRLLVFKARRDRLVAERDASRDVGFSPELVRDRAPDTQAAMAAEKAMFEVRERNREVERRIAQQRRKQLRSLIDGIKAQNAALKRQSDLIGRELKSVQKLVAKGLERQPRALALEREEAEISRDLASNLGEIARTTLQIDEISLETLRSDTGFLNSVMVDLAETDREIADLEERLLVAGDVLARTTVVAPLDGIVVDLQFTTVGGVVRPGAVILDLLPTDEKLIVEARVAPDDIDVVELGLPALVTMTALNLRISSPLSGRVVHISADRLVDESNGLSYYLARIALDETSVNEVKEFTLKAGMNAEVRIVTGERTLLQYLTAPISQSLDRALTEQ
jgi:HlyD family type I secretion membrane fusion protein